MTSKALSPVEAGTPALDPVDRTLGAMGERTERRRKQQELAAQARHPGQKRALVQSAADELGAGILRQLRQAAR